MKIHRVSHSDLCIRRVVCINVNDEVGKKLHLTYLSILLFVLIIKKKLHLIKFHRVV